MHTQVFDKVKDQYKEYFSKIPLRSVIVDSCLGENAKNLLESLDVGRRFLIVSDVHTYAVLGHKIEKALSGYNPKSLILPKDCYPNKQNVDNVVTQAEKCDAIIAVGSGTINDICKYAGYIKDKPYIVFGTAPSMNGYSSANASIIVEGHKKTLKAQLPIAIFLDIDILESAPKRLIRSGLGDSLCRSTAQADWFLSSFILGTYYNQLPFDMLLDNEKILLENSDALVSGDKGVMKVLADTLILSGLGMYMCGGSYPASQGEHMIAHTIEMVFSDKIPYSYHGEQIGVTALTMAKLQEDLIFGIADIADISYNKGEIIDFFGEKIGSQCLEEYKQKADLLLKIENIANEKWLEFINNAQKNLIDSEKIENSLKKAGCYTSFKDLGLDKESYDKAVKYAKYSRNRFTFLDLVKK